jgi:hypothetical protein
LVNGPSHFLGGLFVDHPQICQCFRLEINHATWSDIFNDPALGFRKS